MLIWKNQQTVYNPKLGNWSACHEEEADFYNPSTHNCTNPKPSTANTENSEAAKPHFLSSSSNGNSSNGSGKHQSFVSSSWKLSFSLKHNQRKPQEDTNALKTLSSSEMCFSNTKGCVVVLPGDGEKGKKELKKTWTETNGKDDPFFTNCSPSTLRASSVSSSSFSSSCSSSFINTKKSNN